MESIAGLEKSRIFAAHFRNDVCPDGGIGRRAGLKHQWIHFHPGSTPGLGTEAERVEKLYPLFFFYLLVAFWFSLFKKRNPDNEALSGFTCSFIVVCDPPGAFTAAVYIFDL